MIKGVKKIGTNAVQGNYIVLPVKSRVADRDWLYPDPDPTFEKIPDPDPYPRTQVKSLLKMNGQKIKSKL